jgi:hypothetical protein
VPALLDVVVLHGREVECATCGARGRLTDHEVSFSDEGSVITMREKRDHFFEIQETAQRHAEQRDEIERRASAYDDFDRFARPNR